MTEHTRRELLRLAAAAGAGAALGGPLAQAALAAPATQSYDDGSAEIPGGLAGDVERVVVIGAGWAGLTVANALRNAGVDHVVLEARERLGGRANTVELGGFPIDLGCSWIHSPVGNPMARFADQAGVQRSNGDVELDAPVMRFFDGHLDRELNPLEKPPPFGHALNFAANESGAIADELGPGASVRDGARVYLDRWMQQGAGRRHAEHLIQLLSEFTYGHDWAEMSLEHWAWPNRETTYLGVGQGDFPVGGYRRLIRAMAGSESVRLRHRVRAIETGRRGVVVRATTARGRRVSVRGSHVVVAAPLGVLKAGAIRFDPGLPAAKRAAVARTGVGAVEKVALVFDDAFWSDALHTHMVYVSDHAPLEFPLWIDLHRTAGVPGLIAFYGGRFARAVRTMPPDDRVALTLARLREILGRPVPRPRASAATDWQRDPWSMGSYSTMLLGWSPDDLDTLAAPVRGRVLFAGEATSRARHSTADGALTSGIREAKRLLRRPAVGLSAG